MHVFHDTHSVNHGYHFKTHKKFNMKRTCSFLFIATLLLSTLFSFSCRSAEVTEDVSSGSGSKIQSFEPAVKSPTKETSIIAAVTAQLFVKQNFTEKKFDETLAHQVMDEYIRQLDSNRIFFLQDEVDALYLLEKQLLVNTAKGDLSIPFAIYNLRTRKIAKYREFVHEYLSKPVSYQSDEMMQTNRSEAKWPKNEEEQKMLWSQRIKNDLIVSQLAERSDKEAEKKSKEEEKDAQNTGNASGKKKNYTSLLSPVERINKRADTMMTTINSMEPIDVMESYLVAFTAVFDPHSTYMSPSTGKDFDIHMSLNLTGIGAVLTSEDGYTKVVEVVPGGPADKQGQLQENDRIIEIQQEDGEPVDVIDMNLNRVVSMIRGKEGTYVTLTILPAKKGRQATPEKVRIQRAQVPMSESSANGHVCLKELPNGKTLKIGVIDLPSFYIDFEAARHNSKNYASSFNDVKKILDKFTAEKIDGLIIDLRSNGGGSLSEAVAISGLFVKNGPIVQVRSKDDVEVLDDSDNNLLAYDGPMIVMINRASASASEIFAAAMKDYKRALIVGEPRSHGKGSVQVLTDISRYTQLISGEKFNAGEIKITNAKFYRINGESTQLNGVSSDIVLPSIKETEETGERSLRYALPWDTIQSTKYKEFEGPYAITEAMIQKLRRESEARIGKNEEFTSLKQAIALMDQIQDRKEISLDPEKRWKEYQDLNDALEKEEKISKISSKSNSGRTNSQKEKEDDIYLKESVNIMSDMIQFSQGTQNKEKQ